MAERARVLLPLTDSPSVVNVCCNLEQHRRTSQGLRGLQPPDSSKTIIFRAKAKFLRQKPAAKNEKKRFFLYLLNEKNGIHSVERDKVPEIQDFC